MKKLHLLPIGVVDPQLLEWLGQVLFDKFRMRTEILSPPLNPSFAFHAERQQYHSSEILASMQPYVNGSTWRLLGITQLVLSSLAAGILRASARQGRAGQSPAHRVGA